MLSNAYILAKFRFDTAENEPAKNLQKFGPKKIAKICSQARGLELLQVVRGVAHDRLDDDEPTLAA